jgi:hypothetical protein
VLRLHISVALQQKTANFNMAIPSRLMQWSVFTEEQRKIKLLHGNEVRENKGSEGGVGKHNIISRLLTLSASAIRWQSTEAPSPRSADFKMPGSYLPATRAAAAACKQE